MTVRHAALAPLDAPTLVEASAGTGKTYTITTYLVRGIVEHGHSPSEILVVTYTKAATADLRKRARERILEALARVEGTGDRADLLNELLPDVIEQVGRETVELRLRTALAMMDQAAVLTIHGFCQRLLQEEPLAFDVDFEFEVGEDSSLLHRELATDYWASELYDKPDWLVRALETRKVDTVTLAKLAERAIYARVPVLGPDPVDFDENLLKRVVRARRKVGDCWLANRAEVQQLLTEHQSLSRRSYGARHVPKWFPELDAFASREGLEEHPRFFRKLAQGSMTVKQGYQEPRHPLFEACAEFLDAREAARPMLDRAVFDFQRKFLDAAESEVRRRRAQTRILSYDDLLTIVHDRIVGDSSVANLVARKYPLALVDEFQDTDSLQYAIFRAVYGKGACVYVGDPKQAIYAFRGADVHSYVAASNDVGKRRWTLDTNRRSDPAMVDAINRLFGRFGDVFRVEGVRFDPVRAHAAEPQSNLTPALDLVWLEQERFDTKKPSIAEIAASEVVELLRSDTRIEGRKIEPADIAVLCRSNAKAREVTGALRALNVPTSLEGDSSVLSTEMARAVRAVLEAALLPGDSRAVRRAILTPLIGRSPREVVDMSDAEWTTWVARFQRWHALWRESGVVRFLEDVLRIANTETRIAATPTAERELTDLFHIEELLMRGERERHRDPIALLQWYRRLEGRSPDEGMVRSEDLQQRADADSGAVRITTIHKSKGLEYGVVFCPFTWKDASLFDDERVAVQFHDDEGAAYIDVGSSEMDAHLERAEREKLSEALRVLYVALTRAKHRCTVFWGRAPGWHRSALASLLHGPEPDKTLDESTLRGQLESFARSSAGSVGCRAPVSMPVKPLEDATIVRPLEARPISRSYSQAPLIASFSSLTGHEEKVPSLRPSEDDGPARPPLFAALPGGTRTGLLLHSILENVDLGALADAETLRLIERQLSDYGFATSLAPSIRADLGVVSETPLLANAAAPTLRDVGAALRELEFMLSLDQPDLGRLADILERNRAPATTHSYPSRLREMQGQSLESFLRGFVDLVFEWDGRWYVADYKSNSLPDYGVDGLADAVQRNHYVLQALFYSAATRRYLTQRLPGFDPYRHWGGAMFLFLRGMGGAGAPGHSIWFEAFSPELMDALEIWLGGGDESR